MLILEQNGPSYSRVQSWLDELQDLENELTVASFTAGVNEEGTVKAIWEKKIFTTKASQRM